MNIFFLDRDPAIAARLHCDKHVVKMILESAQLLSTAHRILDGEDKILTDEREDVLYKATHVNHPSAVWTRSGVDQYRWVHDLLYFLIYEYRARYGKSHKTEKLQPHLLNAPYNINWEEPWTDPPQCMPEDVQQDNPVLAYRDYYAKYKSDIAKWAHGPEPVWWNETIQRLSE